MSLFRSVTYSERVTSRKTCRVIHLSRQFIQKIELNSVFLQELRYENILESPNEAYGCVIHGISISKSLTSLVIHNNRAITFEWFDQIKIALSHTTHLCLDGCHPTLKCVRVSSGSLRRIDIGIQGFEELIIVDASKLQKLKLTC